MADDSVSQYCTLLRFGRLAKATGLTLSDVAAWPADKVDRMMIINDEFDRVHREATRRIAESQ